MVSSEYRSKIFVQYEILKFLTTGERLISHVCRTCNIGHYEAAEILKILEDNKLIKINKTLHRTIISVTPDGMIVFSKMHDFINFLNFYNLKL